MEEAFGLLALLPFRPLRSLWAGGWVGGAIVILAVVSKIRLMDPLLSRLHPPGALTPFSYRPSPGYPGVRCYWCSRQGIFEKPTGAR